MVNMAFDVNEKSLRHRFHYLSKVLNPSVQHVGQYVVVYQSLIRSLRSIVVWVCEVPVDFVALKINSEIDWHVINGDDCLGNKIYSQYSAA